MAQIELVMTTLETLDKSYKKYANEVEDVIKSVKKTQGKLNNQVEAKMSIDNRFARIQNLLQKEKTYFNNAAKLCDTAYADFKRIDTQQANILKGTDQVPTSKSTIQGILTSNYVSKYGSMAGFLLAGGSALMKSELSKWNTKMTEMNKSVVKVTDGIKEDRKETTRELNALLKTKPYVNDSSVNSNKKGYSGYSVVAGFETEYCFKQGNYNHVDKFYKIKKNGERKSVSCPVVASATAISMLTGGKMEPDQILDKNGNRVFRAGEGGMHWSDVQEIKYSSKAPSTEQGLLSGVYKNVKDGKPVIMALGYKSGDYGQHYVTVIGIKDGANANNLSTSDLLIMDPADGKVKTLKERLSSTYQLSFVTEKNPKPHYSYRVCTLK